MATLKNMATTAVKEYGSKGTTANIATAATENTVALSRYVTAAVVAVSTQTKAQRTRTVMIAKLGQAMVGRITAARTTMTQTSTLEHSFESCPSVAIASKRRMEKTRAMERASRTTIRQTTA